MLIHSLKFMASLGLLHSDYTLVFLYQCKSMQSLYRNLILAQQLKMYSDWLSFIHTHPVQGQCTNLYTKIMLIK